MSEKTEAVPALPAVSAQSLTPAASLPPGDPPLAFSPLQGESDRAFEAFRAYLELGPRRRYLAVGRKVGVSLRTVKRWAVDFDWRRRIQSHTAQCAEQSTQFETAVQREELLDVAARVRAFRERQYALADAILDVAERYLERVEDEDLEQLRFSDACKALDLASRIARHIGETAAATPDHSLWDQLTALLDQACVETSTPATK